MNVFELVAKLVMDTSEYDGQLKDSEQKSKGFASKLAGSVGQGLATVAKVGAAAVGAATVAVAGLTKAAISNYSEYEQLVGGIDTLFKKDAQEMVQYANQAFKTAGLSVNDYMSTAIESSAAMINSLGGDTKQAAELTNMAIIDMSDNVNKMGTTMEAVQNAYRGFSRGNFTMLDNLALGFAGTKEGMQELLDKAQEISGFKYDISSYSDIVKAIHVVQNEMGITGTTSREAATTVQGSLNSMKAAWQNLLTGLSGGTEEFGQDIDQLIDNLIDSLIGYEDEAGERVGGVINNIMPQIEKTLEGIGKLVEGLAPIIASKLPGIITALLPSIASSITTLIQGAAGVIPTVISILTASLPQILDAGFQIITALAQGIMQNLPAIVDAATTALVQFTDYLSSHAGEVVEGALAMIAMLAQGLLQALPSILEAAGRLVVELVAHLMMKAAEFLQVAGQWVQSIISGITGKLGQVRQSAQSIGQSVKDGLNSLISSATTWGRDMMNNFISGIQAKFAALRDTVANAAQTVRNFLGFSEPEQGPLSNFHTYAPDMMKLFAKGITDNEHLIEDAFNNSLDLASPTVVAGSVSAPGGQLGEQVREFVVNITEMIDGSVLARNQYRYNLDEADRHGGNLINAYA